jgi:hypothetical protein
MWPDENPVQQLPLRRKWAGRIMQAYAQLCISACAGNARNSADKHAQTSVSEHGDRHCPRPAGGRDGAEAARRVAQAGRATIRRRIRLPESAARKVSASVRRACIPDTYAASGPNREPERILIPGDGAAGDQGLRIGLPARQWRLRDAAGCPVSTTSWRYRLRRTCRLVTGRPHRPRSTWPDQARLAFLAVTHRYSRTHCL